MWSRHLAPDYSDLAALSLSRSLVDECDTLAEVESVSCQSFVFLHRNGQIILSSFWVVDAFDLQK